MLRLALSSLRAHARRYASTVLAVALGVAFLSGVLVMVATFQRSFDDMFSTGAEGVAVSVRSDTEVDLGFGDSARGQIDAALADDVAAVDGVAAVAVERVGTAQIEGADGEIVGGGGPPQEGVGWIADDTLNPWVIVDGTEPTGTDGVVVDRASARQGDLEVGDTTRVLTPEPVEVTVVGIARFGTADSQGPLTTTLFSEEGAIAHLGLPAGQADGIRVAAEPGVDEATLTARVADVLPDGVEAITGSELAEESQAIGDDFMSVLRPALLAFALIALLVGTVSIYNTFAIVVAQRARDAALLRAIGASRRQILSSTLVEAGIVGLVGGIVGLGVGIALAALLTTVMASFTGLGGTALVIGVPTVATALLVGLGVTVVAALVPARRASRVPPVAALRDVAVDGGRVGTVRTVVAAGIVGVALVVGLVGGVAGESATLAGAAAALLLLGAIVAAPVVAPGLVRVVGAPLSRIRGVTGLMARRNAVRNPRRTGSTATALIIGVAVVALFTVIGASVRASLDEIIDTQIAGDVVVQGPSVDGFVGLAPSLLESLRELPEADAVAGFGGMPATVADEDTFLGFSDATEMDEVVDLDVTAGDPSDVVTGTIAVSDGYAEDNGLSLGDTVPVTYIDGVEEDLEVTMLYGTETLAGTFFVDTSTVTPHAPQVGPGFVAMTAAEGVSAEELDAVVGEIALDTPGTTVETRAEFAESQGRSIDQMLLLIYVLLALSIGIALMGIANTISLSTIERRHELGLLRAVGQTRTQVRSMVRWEAVMVSVLGTLTGLAVGVAGAAMVVKAAGEDFDTVAVPPMTMLVIVVIGAAAGVLASARPARRAARTDVLPAIATA